MAARLFFVTAIAICFATASAFAGTPTIEGIVKDSTGQPVKGACVWIEATNGKHWSKVVKTEANGRYICEHMAVGSYKVAVIVNGSVKTAIVNTTTQPAKPTEVNFALTERVRAGKTHMVWIPAETGSHVGRWIEIDENGNPVNTVGAVPTQRAAGDALSQGVGR
jgi:hypothetical protein